MLYLILLLLGFQSHSEWHVFVSSDNTFQVMIPGEFHMSVDSIELDSMTQTITTYLYSPPDSLGSKNSIYMLSYTDYEFDEGYREDVAFIKDFFQASLESSRMQYQGIMDYGHILDNAENPTQLARISYNNDQNCVKSKMILVDSRFYYLQVFFPKRYSLNEDMDIFLDSFKTGKEVQSDSYKRK